MTAPPRTSAPTVIVIGGGLAGMAAAVALQSVGCTVTILEASRRLGGRAGSFKDPQTGEEIDSCQHVLLGCCTNLQDFYKRIGCDSLIRFQHAINFISDDGRHHTLGATPGLPAPLHLGPSFLGFGALTLQERLAAAKAMLAMTATTPAALSGLADVPFGDWLEEHAQPDSLVAKLYDPVLISALNEDTRKASSAYAIHVFQGSLLSNSRGIILGVPTVPLSRLYDRPFCRDIRTGARVGEVIYDGATATGIRLTDGELLQADAIILATGHQTAARLAASAPVRDGRFANLDGLQSVPILGAYLRFDRPILSRPHAAFLSGPLQWVFKDAANGCILHGVISAAREWAGRPKEECLDAFVAQLRRLLPAARSATLEYGTVVVEKRATFSAVPGVDAFRPAQAPPADGIGNLFLAGDYTRTGWPATMEGAVRSGYLAADAAAGLLLKKPVPSFLMKDLPPQWPMRIIQSRA
jgi:zeta-carotene desaturase